VSSSDLSSIWTAYKLCLASNFYVIPAFWLTLVNELLSTSLFQLCHHHLSTTSSTLTMAPLFPPWRNDGWIPQNDSLRGGSSTGALTVISGGRSAVFSGVLDSRTLGGAGFASVRTTGIESWDWSGENGLEIKLNGVCFSVYGKNRTANSEPAGGNKKVFTLVLKTDIPDDPNENEKSTISYEYNFSPFQNDDETTIIAPFSSFKPFYRGRPVPDAPPLDIKNVKRMSFMTRSFFGKPEQEGRFRLEIASVSTTSKEGNKDDEEWEKVDVPEAKGWWCSLM